MIPEAGEGIVRWGHVLWAKGGPWELALRDACAPGTVLDAFMLIFGALFSVLFGKKRKPELGNVRYGAGG